MLWLTKQLSNISILFYCSVIYFLGDGSVCSTTSSTDNGGDVDAFLLQVHK